MSGLSSAIEVGKRGLLAYQKVMNIIGHNTANVNTPGFSRQRSVLQTTTPVGNMGTGVEASKVERLRDSFLDSQFRAETHRFKYWESLANALSQVERLLNEPSENALGALLDKFWNCWQDLADNPEDLAPRYALREVTISLTNAFHHLSARLKEVQQAQNAQVEQQVDRINQIADEVAELNSSIVTAESDGSNACDLRDKRDLLLDELSELVNLKTVERENGSVSVFISGHVLVEDFEVERLSLRESSIGRMAVSLPIWQENNQEVELSSGSLKGLLVARDELIPEYRERLDSLARELVEAINQIHSRGYGLNSNTGVDFFDSTELDAENITLDGTVARDVREIAASSDGTPGDNSIALEIAALRESLQMESNTLSFGQYYNSLVSEVGAKAKEASETESSYQLLAQQMENQRNSAMGVSLDEEMIELVKCQHAYQAAARMVATVNEMMDAITNIV